MGTIVAIIGVIIVIGGAGAAFLSTDGRARFGGFVVALVGVVVVLSTMVTTVGARSVAIKTSLGKYEGSVGPGLHLTAPWTSVEEWTTRNQTIRFAGDGKGEERDNFFTEPRVSVRLGNQSQAYVDVTVTWVVTEQSVGPLWKQHKTFSDARRDFATPAAQGAVGAAFDGYDPFRGINTVGTDQKDSPAPAVKKADGTIDVTAASYVPLEIWSELVKRKLMPLYDSRSVKLVNVQVTYVGYDQRTEAKLREYSDAVANTRIKAQDVETAKQEAAASKERAAQASQGCAGLVRDLAAQDKLKDVAPGVQICEGAQGGGVNVNAK